MREAARAQHRAIASAYPDEKRAVSTLARMVYQDDAELRTRHGQEMRPRLALPTYERLLGVEGLCTDLTKLVEVDGAPAMILVHGIGSIGKTSLIGAVMRQVLNNSEAADFAWVTAKQHSFRLDGHIAPADNPVLSVEELLEALLEQITPGAVCFPFSLESALAILKPRLMALPHLIVVDNLETFQDTEVLLPVLRRLTGPTKVILTAWVSLPAQPDIYHLAVPQLSKTAALALVRHEAETRPIPRLVFASDAEARTGLRSPGRQPAGLAIGGRADGCT